MKKIPSVFERNHDGDKMLRDEVLPGSEWVIAGEGIATRKWDGTACLVRDGRLFKRYDAKNGKAPPPGFEPCQEPDPVTGHWPGWVPVGDGPEDQWFRAAWEALSSTVLDGTHELCGPKIGANPEGFAKLTLIRHGALVLRDAPRTFDGLRAYLVAWNMEGVVFHHPDGRMAKVKRTDFGLAWNQHKARKPGQEEPRP